MLSVMQVEPSLAVIRDQPQACLPQVLQSIPWVAEGESQTSLDQSCGWGWFSGDCLRVESLPGSAGPDFGRLSCHAETPELVHEGIAAAEWLPRGLLDRAPIQRRPPAQRRQ